MAALHSGDLGLLGRSVTDALVEPLRARLIPGLRRRQGRGARARARLGCSIAGRGPSVFAFGADEASANRTRWAMCETFRREARLECDLYVGGVSPYGARVVDGRLPSEL